MGQGSTPAAGEAGVGGNMGLPLIGSLMSLFGGGGGGTPGAYGMSGAEGASVPMVYGNEPATAGALGAQGPSFWSKLAQVASDPNVLKALGGAAQGIAKSVGHLNDIPAEHAASLIQAAQPRTGDLPQPGSHPFLGDIPNFSPQQAQTLLQAMGIPGGFRPIGGGY